MRRYRKRWQWDQRSPVANESGASPAIEYSMFAILITLICIVAATLMFEKVRDVFAVVPQGIHTTT